METEAERRHRMGEEYLLDNPWAGLIVTISLTVAILGLGVGFVCALGYLMGY